jgi:hypothetical protein
VVYYLCVASITSLGLRGRSNGTFFLWLTLTLAFVVGSRFSKRFNFRYNAAPNGWLFITSCLWTALTLQGLLNGYPSVRSPTRSVGVALLRVVIIGNTTANDAECLQLLQNGAPLSEYLRRESVAYLVELEAVDSTMPYRALWDHSRFFHRTEPWSDLEKEYVEAGQADPIFVLRNRRVWRHADGRTP